MWSERLDLKRPSRTLHTSCPTLLDFPNRTQESHHHYFNDNKQDNGHHCIESSRQSFRRWWNWKDCSRNPMGSKIFCWWTWKGQLVTITHFHYDSFLSWSLTISCFLSTSQSSQNLVMLTINVPNLTSQSTTLDLTKDGFHFSAKAGNQAKGIEEKDYEFKLDFFDQIDVEVSHNRRVTVWIWKESSQR